MNRSTYKLVAVALASAVLLGPASCASEKKPEGTASTPAESPEATKAGSSGAWAGTSAGSVSIQPGVAGGVVEDTFKTTVTVTAIDRPTRQVTLTGENGAKTTFTAGPEIRNLDRVNVGDKVNATITERLAVFVRSDGAGPSVARAAAQTSAPKGAAPGMMVAQAYEVVATVKAIDSEQRTATLQFADGRNQTFPVRPDVDLTRYKVGDSVVIQVTAALSLLVEKP